MKPTVIGIGAQTCASSWIHSVLGVHPQIGVSDPKAVNFFSHHFDRGFQWYERHFNHLKECFARCDISPSYFYDPRAPKRAWRYDPTLRIVCLLGDPVDRAFDNHLQEVRRGHIEPQSFEEGLRNNPSYLDQGLYYTHLKRWFETFGWEKILVLLSEEIHADPVGSAARLYDFLGVTGNFVAGVAADKQRSHLVNQSRALPRGGDFKHRIGLEEQIARVKSANPANQGIRDNLTDLRHQIPPMREITRQRLADFYESEVASLTRLLGRTSLPWDTRDAHGAEINQPSVAS